MAQIAPVAVATPTPFDALHPSVPLPRTGGILLLEDRDDVRLGVAQLLDIHGFEVIEARNTEQAISLLLINPPSVALILLDLLLPGPRSGRDFRAYQLAHQKLSSIPAIIMSACEDNPADRAILRPTAWLEKPFRFDALLALVTRYVMPDRAEPLGVMVGVRTPPGTIAQG